MKKVLVVEDTKSDYEYFKHMAQGLCEVDVSTSNLDAFEKLRNNKYDAIFVDQILHDSGEGLETVLFALAHKLSLKIVILTGLRSLAVATAAKAFKVHLLVEKPITREVIDKVLFG